MKICIVLAIVLTLAAWWIPGKDILNYKNDDTIELSFSDAKKVLPTYNVSQGNAFMQSTYFVQRERTNVPFVYKRDTMKVEITYFTRDFQ